MKTWFYLPTLVFHCLQCTAAERVDQSVVRSDPLVVERSAHEQQVQYTTTRVEDGTEVTSTNSYVQLQTGLNRWDEQSREFVPASAEIEMVNGHGVIRNAQYRAIFSRNVNEPTGLVDLFTPDGERLVTQPIGIALTESDTGKSVFLAELKNSEAVLFDPHTLIYPNAFDQFNASVAIRSHLHGIESDIILEEKIDRALLAEFGINPEMARIEVWHQVLTKPDAAVESAWLRRLSNDADQDHTVHLNKMVIGPGNAFSIGAPESRLGRDGGIPVAKEWTTIDGLDFLIERVPFLEAEEELKALADPLEARVIDKARLDDAFTKMKRKEKGESVASVPGHDLVKLNLPSDILKRTRPLSVAAYAPSRKPNESGRDLPKPSGQVLAHANSAARSADPFTSLKGFLIDFSVLLTGQSDYTLRGDTTYWVTGDVSLSGKTVLEGGAVVKFTNYTAVNPVLKILDEFECNTSPYNVAIFTAEDDNTVGETIASSTGVPLTSTFYSWFNLWFRSANTAPVMVHDIQSRYSHVGIGFDRPVTPQVWNVQIYNCYRGLDISHLGIYSTNLIVRNVLMHKTRYAFNSGSATGAVIHAEQLTVNSAKELFLASTNNGCSLRITNSILCNVTNQPSFGIVSNTVYVVQPSAFTTVGRGNHYLLDSTYRNLGNTNISSEAFQILRQTTTYPPLHLTNDFISDTSLHPVVQRDVDLPDVGYHYAPLDYLMGERNVTNATLTLTNGVSVGLYGTNGLLLRNGSKLHSTGRPDAMNILVRYQSVQEDPATSFGATSAGTMSLVYVTAPSTDPEVQFRFSRANVIAASDGQRHFIRGYIAGERIQNFAIRDCSLANTYHYHDASVGGGGATIDFLNNIFLRSEMTFYQASGYYPLTLGFRNNLMRNGSIYFAYQITNSAWTVTDNLFGNVSLSTSGSMFTATHNGYHNTSLLGSSYKTVAVLDFMTGQLGQHYYPTSGTNLYSLVNFGSRNSTNAGLYHFTTFAAGTKETNSVVDIGFHYAATNGGEIPADSDADGSPDYFEDTDGDGAVDTGETSFLSKTDAGLSIFITEPKAHSNIP